MNATMIFTMGLPAAGKSYVVSKRYAGYNVLDPDAVKASHPDYDPKNPQALHAWSQEEIEAQFSAALAARSGQWVVDGTGTNSEKMVRRMNAAAASGFAVTLLYVRCTLATSLKRNAARERNVPESVVRSKARDISTSFDIVAPYAGTVEIVDNN